MELIFILIVIGVFLSVLTGNIGILLYGASAVLFLLSVLMVLIFSVCCILLLFSKWKKASFVKLALPHEKARFQVAIYLVEGEEVPCLFPEEGVFRRLFYRSDRTCQVLYHRKLGRVFDRYSVCTCILGLVAGLIMGNILLAMYL